MPLAITGATGFVGGHLIDAARAAGHPIRALTRRPQPPREGVAWIEGGLDQPDALAALARGAGALIHVAGAINARDRAEYERVNVAGTAAALAAARAAGVARFVQVSSLAAREPALSDYGWSKAGGDALVLASGIPAAIVRPAGVYGPGDRETLELFRAVKAGFLPAFGRGRFSFVHVADTARALLALAQPDAPGGVFELGDARARGFDMAELAHLVAAALGVAVRVPRLPAAIIRVAAAASAVARAFGGSPKLTPDRARIFLHADWIADIAPLVATGRWRPEIAAERGFAETATWYRAQGWL